MTDHRRAVKVTDEATMIVASNCVALRKALGLSQADLARAVGCDSGTISKIELLRRGIRVDFLGRLATAFGVEPAALLNPRLSISVVIDDDDVLLAGGS